MGDQQMASNNPFNYSEWLRCETSTSGSMGTGDDVELGRRNWPDAREGTQIWGSTPNNVALAGIYEPFLNSSEPGESPSEPGVGVYGEGHNDRGIGVAGTCDHKGIGVCGLALDNGVGVVGRQTYQQVERFPLFWLIPGTAGVLGHADDGVGVFGHGGPLVPPGQDWEGEGGPPPPPLPNPTVVGGIFSAGWRTTQNVPPATRPQLVSLSHRSQIQLLPSKNQTLPEYAQLGEIYFVMAKYGSEAEKATVGFLGQLWICTQILDEKPIWQPVLLGTQQPGGTEVPPYVYPP
jgi:hypothetical protein